jgi:predicted GIY-YIG superfamily endonuclease
MDAKICTKCDTDKPIEDYYTIVNKNGTQYTYNYCKKCHYSKLTKHTAKKWRKANPERWKQDALRANMAFRERQTAGVYLIFTDKGLYVGHSNAIPQRIKQHKTSNEPGHCKGKGAKYYHHIVLAEEDNYYKRCKLEKQYIQLLKPELNKMYNPDWVKRGYKLPYEKR